MTDVASIQLRTFISAETGDEMQTVSVSGQLWIVAGPLAKALSYRDAADMIRSLPVDERGTQSVRTPGGVQVVSVVSQPGLYRILATRRLGVIRDETTRDRIEKFQRWVFHEVIPAAVAGDVATAPAQVPVALPTRRELALMVVDAEDRADRAEAELAAVTPKAEAWDSLANATGDYSVADAAKMLSRHPLIKVGQQRLFTLLDQMGWTYRRQLDFRWTVYQSAVDTGWLTELASSHYHPRTGELVLDAPQVRVTAKGLGELHGRLSGAGQVALTS